MTTAADDEDEDSEPRRPQLPADETDEQDQPDDGRGGSWDARAFHFKLFAGLEQTPGRHSSGPDALRLGLKETVAAALLHPPRAFAQPWASATRHCHPTERKTAQEQRDAWNVSDA
jgi:hypothetical protein